MKHHFLKESLILSLICLFIFGSISYTQSLNKQSDSLALVHCSIIDGTGAPPLKDRIILINKGRIKQSGAAGDIAIPAEYQKIDLAGAFVLPGFINAHVHNGYNETNLQRWLQAGVTTVRDLGPHGSFNFVKERDRLNLNPLNTRLVSATPLITKPQGYGSCYINSPEEAERQVTVFIKSGIDVIKIAIEDNLQGRVWPMLTSAEVRRIVNSAHTLKKRVSAHISHTRNLQIAIDAGVDDISHMVVEPLDEKQLHQIVEKNIYWEPTLELWQGVSKIHSLDWDRITLANLARFYKAGGKVALGTDFDGYVCQFDRDFPITEVALMQQAGMSNMDIIIAGTRNAAYVCDLERELGTIEQGKIADLLVVGRNPLDDLKVLQKPYLVIHNGLVVNKGNSN